MSGCEISGDELHALRAREGLPNFYEARFAAWESGPQLDDPPQPPVGARVYHRLWGRYGTTTEEWLPVIEEVGVRFDTEPDRRAVVKLRSLDFL